MTSPDLTTDSTASDQSALLAALNAMDGASVLVVGDIMYDRFVYGTVDRISPEGPIPVLNIKRDTQMLGGAGNVIANLRGLGCAVDIVSVVGQDDNAATVRAMLRDQGVSDDGLIAAADRPTIAKIRYVAGSQQLLRTDFEKAEAVNAETEDKILALADDKMKTCRALILSDYGKGVLTPRVIASLIDLGRKNGCAVLVDPKGSDYTRYRGADVVKPNRKELGEAVKGAPTKTDDDIKATAQTLIKQAGIKAVVATLAEAGMALVTESSAAFIRSKPVEVFDVSGAGDTVIATLAAGLAAGVSLHDSARLANLGGSIVVTRVGTAAIRKQDLVEALASGHRPAADDAAQKPVQASLAAPLLPLDRALEEVERWRAKGLKVGLTNGCFDLLHAGHVNYLNKARTKCDRMIVAINTDVSVRLLKGPTRPVNNEQSRATVLGGLAAIDMIVLFGADTLGADNTASPVIQVLKPDLYFKGADYTIDRIPEAKIVQGYGGKVELIELTEGQSTTGTIARISAA